MSKQSLETDLNTPFTPRTANKMRGHINKMSSFQAVAATLAGDFMGQATEAWFIGDLYLLGGGAVAAAGESMTFDVQVNGVTILTGLYTLDDTVLAATHADQISLLSLITAAGRELAINDVVTCDRVYTAGGGPTPIVNTQVVLEPAIGPYVE